MKNISVSEYQFCIHFPNGKDSKQSAYGDYNNIFNHTIELIMDYSNAYPMNPKDKSSYLKHSKICLKQIADTQTRFIDGLINLTEEQLHIFCFFIVRELMTAMDELYVKLQKAFSYKRLADHHTDVVIYAVYGAISNVFPDLDYIDLNNQFPRSIA